MVHVCLVLIEAVPEIDGALADIEVVEGGIGAAAGVDVVDCQGPLPSALGSDFRNLVARYRLSDRGTRCIVSIGAVIIVRQEKRPGGSKVDGKGNGNADEQPGHTKFHQI